MPERTGVVVRGGIETQRRTSMYTGTIIDDLVTWVERAEASVRVRAEHANSENWFAMAPAELLALETETLFRGVQ